MLEFKDDSRVYVYYQRMVFWVSLGANLRSESLHRWRLGASRMGGVYWFHFLYHTYSYLTHIV